MTRRVYPIADWAPAQEAIYEDTSVATRRNSIAVWQESSIMASNENRLRSLSLSLLGRQRPKSSMFGFDHEERGKGHDQDHGDGDNGGASTSIPRHEQPHNFKGFFRRASTSLKSGMRDLVHRRIYATDAGVPHDEDEQQAQAHDNRLLPRPAQQSTRPTTAQSTWHRLRQAASFHRSSRVAHAGYSDRTSDLASIDSPTLPIPGSGEQPPVIPRNTGAAARRAAANASHDVQEYPDILIPKPNWLAFEDGMDDHESGIGIAPTSSEMEVFVPSDEVDSDVDVGDDEAEDVTDISKIDFIAKLPAELVIQILALLDATALTSVSRVSRTWNAVVENQHIWRESFLREKTTTYATSASVKPGTGMGVPAILPSNDWKAIYRAREQLDKRWKEGRARPVYLNGHSDSIYCLQFDESKIITGSRDRTVRIWDMHTFTCKLVIGPPDAVNDPALSLLYDENGKLVHYASMPDCDGNPARQNGQPTHVREHASTPALVSFETHHNASILCLQYDDQILVTGSSDATCIVYSIPSGYRPVRRLRHHSAAVLDLVFDEKHIVTCSKDVSICVWDRATGAMLKQLRGHSGPVNAVQMRSNTIVSCSGDFKVKLWNIDTGKNIREFVGHKKGLACSQFSEDGRYVASAGNDMTIRIWDANTGEFLREMRAHDKLVRSLHVDSVSGRLISGSYDTDIKVWDMETGLQLLDFPRWHNSWVLSAKSDYRRIVSTGQDPKILIMDFGADVEGIEKLESRPSPTFGLFQDTQGGYI